MALTVSPRPGSGAAPTFPELRYFLTDDTTGTPRYTIYVEATHRLEDAAASTSATTAAAAAAASTVTASATAPESSLALGTAAAPLVPTSEHEEALDAALCDANEIYALFRKKKMLGRARVIGVEPGTFGRLRHRMVAELGCGATQAKVPRVLRRPELLTMLEQCAVGSGSSNPAAPHASAAVSTPAKTSWWRAWW